jgi:hypothetical protein
MITMFMLVAALVAVASGGECPDNGKRITLLEWQREGETVKPTLQQEALTALKVKSFSICAFLGCNVCGFDGCCLNKPCAVLRQPHSEYIFCINKNETLVTL